MSGFDARRNESTYTDWGGEHTAVYVGQCIRCGIRCFRNTDGSGDPRGVLGYHLADLIDPDEYDGPAGAAPVLACWFCLNNDGDHYRQTLDLARKQWATA